MSGLQVTFREKAGKKLESILEKSTRKEEKSKNLMIKNINYFPAQNVLFSKKQYHSA